MLILNLVLSAILIAIVWSRARSPGGSPGLAALVVGLVLALGPAFAGIFFPTAFALQAIVLVGLGFFWTRLSAGRPSLPFYPVVLASLALGYALPSYWAWQTVQEMEALKKEYPIIDLSERLPRQPDAAPKPLEPATVLHLRSLTKDLIDEHEGFSYREFGFLMLHRSTVSHFIASPGFGVARTLRPTAEKMRATPRIAGDTSQPSPKMPDLSPGVSESGRSAQVPSGWYLPLRAAILDFVNPRGFGDFDRENPRLIGLFEPHAFSKRPPVVDAFELKRLELVSLLLNERPVVYVSDHLPAMEKARELPTRPLDEFEAFALAKLKAGEDLVQRQAGKDARVLGSVRSVGQCLRCHGGNEGDLLGAFSYWIQTSEARKSD